MLNGKKLYNLTSEKFELPIYVAGDTVRNVPANDVPVLFWPDGSACWLVNLYIIKGFRMGRSRRNKGGTLLAWAKNLSHLIRWCYQNKCDFIDLTDSHFRMFVNTLQAEYDKSSPELKVRGSQHVATICGTVMNFLAFINETIPGLNLIGPTGRIRAEHKTFEHRTNRGTIKRKTWVHECVPRARKTRTRQPISTEAVNKLYDANNDMEAPAFIVRRRYIMLRLLDITGGRRIEISSIKISDLEDAALTGELKLFTAKKRRDDACRFIPVTKADLKEVMSFVKHYRQRIIRNTIGIEKDHGYLFIGMESGEPLEIDTLSRELWILRKAAGIEDEEACLHAFRHRFITNVFRDLIRTHRYENESDFKRALLSTETLKLKVMEWTGHSSIDALDRYIHLAFEAESDFKETLDILQAKKVIDSLSFVLKDYRSQMRNNGLSPKLLEDLDDVVGTAVAELAHLLGKHKPMPDIA